ERLEVADETSASRFRKHLFKEQRAELLRLAHDVSETGFHNQSPDGAAAAVDAKQTRDGLDARLKIFLADEQQSGDVASGLRQQRAVINAALVHDERADTFGFPRGELVIELTAGGHPPQKQRRGCDFRMVSSGRELRE